MRNILDAGFIFWGLFLVFALLVVAYLAWMLWVERRAATPPQVRTGEELP